MVAEKQVCHLRVTFQGQGGHASLIQQDNPMSSLGGFLDRAQSRKLPIHVKPEARLMFQAIGRRPSPAARAGIAALLNPRLTDLTSKLLGSKGRTLAPLFRNRLNPTMIMGGEQINVVPDVVSVDLDGRLLPNFSPEQLVSKLIGLARDAPNIEYKVLSHYAGPKEPDMGLFETLSCVLQESDPTGIPVAHADACRHLWSLICSAWHSNLRIRANETVRVAGFRRRYSRSKRACVSGRHQLWRRGNLSPAGTLRTHTVGWPVICRFLFDVT